MSDRGQTALSKGSYSFGPFRLCLAERRLKRDGVAVEIGARALDILIALIERSGEFVSNQNLIEKAWPNTFVDESNLRVHMVALRKALGDDKKNVRYISNIPGRGYRFVVPVSLVSGAANISRDSRSFKSAAPGRIVGRESAVREVAACLLEKRFVTIAGPGGIGKTTVALAVAERLTSSFTGNIFFVDLGLLQEPDLVVKALEFAIGLTGQFEGVKAAVKSYLEAKEAIVIFDCCEHLVEEVASLAEELFADIPGVRILATSREILRASGENVYHLAPLELPPPGSTLSTEEALQFSAIQLFVDRASSSIFDFQMSDAEVAMVIDICSQVGGIALAIELAAGRVAAYGIDGVLYLMRDRFRLLTNGRRTALPRHQTLQAAIDWSYDLLPEQDKVVLRRLSVFVAPFTFEAARAVVECDGDAVDQDLVSIFADLAAKSLVAVDAARRAKLYCLLDSTRHYMRGKLVESGEMDQVAHRHARYYQEHLVGFERLTTESKTALDPAMLSADVANVRAALEWCFSRKETQHTGVMLASESAPLFLEMLLVNECLTWVGRALEQLEPSDKGGLLELKLQTIMGLFVLYFRGLTEDAHRAILRGLELAGRLGDVSDRVQLIDGLYLYHIRRGNLIEGYRIAYGKSSLLDTCAEPPEKFYWMRTVSSSLAGEHDEAIAYAEERLGQLLVRRHVHPTYGWIDERVHIFSSYHRSLWARGFPDKALRAVAQTVAEAEGLTYPVPRCICLMWAIPPAIWAGDLVLASQIADRLVACAKTHVLSQFQALATGWQGALLIRNGRASDGVALLRESVEGQIAARHQLTRTSHLLEMAIGEADLGHFDEALDSVDEALERMSQNSEGILLPEAIRIKAEILSRSGASEARVHEMLLRSITIAQEQSALSWQLRSGMSLASARRNTDGEHDALKFVWETLGRFSEGFDTSDLRSARSLLAERAPHMSTAAQSSAYGESIAVMFAAGRHD
jgi:predicted ATPase/DNA-binding winged helix-turn-helix (wHTH) protein